MLKSSDTFQKNEYTLVYILNFRRFYGKIKIFPIFLLKLRKN